MLSLKEEGKEKVISLFLSFSFFTSFLFNLFLPVYFCIIVNIIIYAFISVQLLVSLSININAHHFFSSLERQQVLCHVVMFPLVTYTLHARVRILSYSTDGPP